jgi:agmatine/peptidylarginine deiminase
MDMMKPSKAYGVALGVAAAAGLGLAIWLTRAADGTSAVADARLVADFEPVGAVVLAGHELALQTPDALAELVEALAGHVPVILLTNDQRDFAAADNALAPLDLKPGQVRFLKAAHDSSRIGHYGPLWITRGHRGPVLVEMPRDASDPPRYQSSVHQLASQLNLPIVRAEVCLGGCSLLSNGQGLALTTITALDQNVHLGLDMHLMEDVLRRACGITQTVFLEPLQGEPSGHVRMFAVFTSSDTVVVGKYLPHIDKENAAILDRNAKLLQEVEVEPGKPLTVKRILMPPRLPGIWPSYTSVLFLDGRLIMPSFPEVGLDEQASDLYTELLPQWEIVPVDARPLLPYSGALRSLVLPLGKLDELPDFPEPSWAGEKK